MIKHLLFLIFFLYFTAIFDSPGMASEKEQPVQPTNTSEKEKSDFNLGGWLISLYRDHISQVDGDRCPSIPSCSSYSIKAIRKHGFFIGWMMTVDRLIHEGSEETKTSPLVISDREWKIYDPVENKDFWWFPQEGKRHD